MPKPFEITYDSAEVSKLIKSLERLGADRVVIERKVWEITDKGLGDPIRRRTPRRSGRLQRSIVTTVGERKGALVGLVTQDVGVAIYGPIVHFGWATRGAGKRADVVLIKGRANTKASRQAFRDRTQGVLSQRAADKAFRQAKARKVRGGGLVGPTRGGPIKANPWMYATADRRQDDARARWQKQADGVVALFERSVA